MNWKWLFKIDRALGKMEVFLLATILVGIIVLYTLQTILRNVFSTAILWIDPLVLHSMLWITMLGGSIATLDQRHMSIDLTNKFLSHRARHITMIVTSLSSAIVVWFMATAGMDFIALMQEEGAEEVARRAQRRARAARFGSPHAPHGS